MHARAERAVNAAGIALGLVLVAGALAAWGAPSTPPPGTLAVALHSQRTGELEALPTGRPFAAARGLRPGRGRVAGRLRVRNLTGGVLAVDVRAVLGTHDLEDDLRASVRAHGRERFRGSLRALRRARPLTRLGSGRWATAEVAVWLDARARPGYAGRSEAVRLELTSRAAT